MVEGNRQSCPLCQSALQGKSEESISAFPDVPTFYKKYNFFFRLLIFISVTVASLALVLNFLIPSDTFWSGVVLAGVLGMWASIVAAVRKHRNISKTVLYQVVIISCVIVLLDWMTGWRRWSVDYGIPALFLFGIITIAIIAVIMHERIEDYIIYLFINTLFGVVPLIFVLTGFADVVWPSMVSVLVSIISLTGTLVFSGVDTISELKKRLHI